MNTITLPDDIWKDIVVFSINQHYCERGRDQGNYALMRQAFNLENVNKVFWMGVNACSFIWKYLCAPHCLYKSPVDNNKLAKSVVYCIFTREALKEQMLSFIKENKITYRSPKTNRVLNINTSMKTK